VIKVKLRGKQRVSVGNERVSIDPQDRHDYAAEFTVKSFFYYLISTSYFPLKS
jgi:hypothetical protein